MKLHVFGYDLFALVRKPDEVARFAAVCCVVAEPGIAARVESLRRGGGVRKASSDGMGSASSAVAVPGRAVARGESLRRGGGVCKASCDGMSVASSAAGGLTSVAGDGDGGMGTASSTAGWLVKSSVRRTGV